MLNLLILITSKFPYGVQETFLETEIIYLSRKFSKIIILSHELKSKKNRLLPSNVFVYKIRYNPTFFEKIWSLRHLFNKTFWKEIRLIWVQYQKKISLGIIKTLMISLENSYRLSKEYSVFVSKYNHYNLTLYSYWCNDSAIALGNIKLKKKNNLKCVTRMHRWDLYFKENKYDYLPLRNQIFKNLDNVVSISMDGINYMKEILKFKTTPFRLSMLGVKKQNLKVYKKKKDFLIVSCSNIIPVKRVGLIAEVLNKIRGFNLKWVHFGGGQLQNEIEKYCSKNLSNNIKVEFKGRINNKDILTYYINEQPNLFINLSKSEGLPLSIMEAMSCEIPVLATNVGGTSEIVNNKNGVLIEEDADINLIAKKIEKIYLMNREFERVLRENAYNTWDKHFNAQKNYDEFIELYLK